MTLPRLPACLASARARQRLSALAQLLPGAAVTVLETRLTPLAGGGRVDLSLQVADPMQALAMAGRPASAAGWQRFLRGWAMRPAWRARAPSLWLEFDLAGPSPVALPAPVLAAQLGAVEPAWAAGTLLPAMRGAPLSLRQRWLLERAWGEIPAGGRPLYLFALLSRRIDAVRLEIGGGLGIGALASYLERLNARRQAERVAALQPLLATGSRLHLSLDLGEEVGSRVGVEVSFPRQPPHDGRWRRLFGRLSAAGLCSPAARDAALAWPGQDSLWTAPAPWPVAAGAATARYVRCLSHVKLVCERRRPTAAKLYLLAAPVETAAAQAGPGRGGDAAPPAALSSQSPEIRAASFAARST